MNNDTIIDINEIQRILPHRFPILLVDRVTDIVLKESIEGYKNISFNEHIFQGHFPSKPIYPGVYTLEGLAQVSAILAFKSLEVSKNALFYFASIDKAKV